MTPRSLREAISLPPLKVMKKIHQLFRAFALFSLVCSTALFAADHSGTWTKKSQKIDGTWTIAEGKISLTGLSTRKAPDLKLFLSPLPVAELSNKNAEQGAVFIADLKSNKGDQTYPLPADLDLSAHQSIIMHCRQYTKLWGAGAL
jgi:hypothetical protein